MRRLPLVVLMALVLPVASPGGSEVCAAPAGQVTPAPAMAPGEWSVRVRAVLSAKTDADCEAAIKAMVTQAPDWKTIAEAVKVGPAYPPAQTGWRQDTIEGPDKKQRPWAFYVPKHYFPKTPVPLVILLHGMVSQPKAPSATSLQSMGRMFQPLADKDSWLLAVPGGDQAAGWFDENGAANQLGIFRTVKERFNVDENAVFVAGFSDGGSGSFYMALNHATPLAGAVPMNGWTATAAAGGLPVYLTNLVNVPLHVINTGRDGLYPPRYVQPFIDAMKILEVPVVFKSYPEFGHSAEYWDKESPSVGAFVANTRRNPLPSKIDWETSVPALGRFRWVEITALGATKDDAELKPAQVMIPLLPALAVAVHPSFAGPGVKVLIQPGSGLDKLGLRNDDVVASVDGRPIKTFEELRSAMAVKTVGSSIAVGVRRGEEETTIQGKIPESDPEPSLDLRKPSGRIVAQAVGNRVTVTSRGVSAFRLLVSADQFDLSQPIEVVANGHVMFKGTITPDLGFLLRQAYADQDRKMIFVNKIDVDLTGK